MVAIYALILALASLVPAHFVLQVPASLGFDDVREATAPCGGFDVTSRTGQTDWPSPGAPIQIISTHPQAQWEIRAALLNDTAAFRYLVPTISQTGLGTFCLPAVPGIADWEGKDAVMQMIQHAVDGALYQCAAVRFVSGTAASVPSSCKNSTNVGAEYKPLSASTMIGTATGSPTPTAMKTNSGGALWVNVEANLLIASMAALFGLL